MLEVLLLDETVDVLIVQKVYKLDQIRRPRALSIQFTVLLNFQSIYRISMIDKDCFDGICEVLSIIDHSRRPNARGADCFGPVHILLFGDFKYP